MNRVIVNTLRVFLALLFLGTFAAQFAIMVGSIEIATQAPEFDYVLVPYQLAGLATVACFQVAIVATFALLSYVRKDSVFSRRALRWVDVIIWCAVAATVLVVAVTSHIIFGLQTGGPPPVAMAWLIALIAGPSFILLMLIMRGLLTTAATYRAELEEVI